MTDLDCVLYLVGETVDDIKIYYPATRYKNIIDAPDVTGLEIIVNGHINNSEIHVTATQIANIDTAIAGLIEHMENEGIHVTAEEREAWSNAANVAVKAASDATEALNTAAGLEGRLARVEDGLYNDITGNPYLVSFDTLDGITLTKGSLNTERQRIEC